MSFLKPKKKQLILIMLLLFCTTVVLVLSEYKTLDETVKTLQVLNKKPGELTEIRISAGKTKPQPIIEGSLLNFFSRSGGNRSDEDQISKEHVIKEFRKKLASNSDIQSWSICDILSLSGYNYRDSREFDIMEDFRSTVDFITFDIAAECPNDLSCDPLFKEVSRFNSAEDLDWVRKFSYARSTSDVLKIESDADQIQFMKALVLGDLMYAEPEDAQIDLNKAILLLTELKMKYQGNAVYPFFLMYLKKQTGQDYKSEWNDFLNSTHFEDPWFYFANYIFRQGLTSESMAAIAKVRRNIVPTPVYSSIHDEIMKVEIPLLSEAQRAKLDRLASGQYLVFLNSAGRIIGPHYYMENWMRRTHSKNVAFIQDAFEVRNGTSQDYKMWEKFTRQVSEGQCKSFDELNKVLTSDVEWFSEWSKSQN